MISPFSAIFFNMVPGILIDRGLGRVHFFLPSFVLISPLDKAREYQPGTWDSAGKSLFASAVRYRVTWKMMAAFEFWASGSSTLATSAAVKIDSTLPARANQARVDPNGHANYVVFWRKNGSLDTFLRFPVASENPKKTPL